jgi:ketosteroid isomerase-like protein
MKIAIGIAISLIMGISAATQAASDETAVMTTVNQFVDGFNKGEMKTALAACADETLIIDEFPPHEWRSCSKWGDDYDADAKRNGITDGLVVLSKPRHVDITNDRAYVVVPASYTYKKNGTPMKEDGSILTVVLQKGAAGWRITAWSWAKN